MNQTTKPQYIKLSRSIYQYVFCLGLLTCLLLTGACTTQHTAMLDSRTDMRTAQVLPESSPAALPEATPASAQLPVYADAHTYRSTPAASHADKPAVIGKSKAELAHQAVKKYMAPASIFALGAAKRIKSFSRLKYHGDDDESTTWRTLLFVLVAVVVLGALVAMLSAGGENLQVGLAVAGALALVIAVITIVITHTQG